MRFSHVFSVDEGDMPGKKVVKSINFDTASPEVQEGLRAARENEWGKFESFAAAIPIVGQQKADLLAEGGFMLTRLSTRKEALITPQNGKVVLSHVAILSS